MRKMPCLFARDFSDKRRPVLLQDVSPGCEWVIAGEGVATRKRDGTSCLWLSRKLYKRYDVKRGKSVPGGAIPCEPEPDPVTGHWPHWIAVGEEPESRWYREARNVSGALPDGTYELCGERLQGNPEGFTGHVFIRHGAEVVPSCPREWDALRNFLSSYVGEGIVFHHPDGRMCKIRRDDFGFSWPIRDAAKAGSIVSTLHRADDLKEPR
jgi:hypothetical protein